MKAGFKTTEFWVTIGVGLLKAFVPSIPDELIALGGAYVVSRGVAKAGKTPTPPAEPSVAVAVVEQAASQSQPTQRNTPPTR